MRAQAASADRRSPRWPAAISRRRICSGCAGGSGSRPASTSRVSPARAAGSASSSATICPAMSAACWRCHGKGRLLLDGGPPERGGTRLALLADRAHRWDTRTAHELVEGRHVGLRDLLPLGELRVGALAQIREDLIHRFRRREVGAANSHRQAPDLEVELRRVVERVLAALRLHLDELFLDAATLRLERGCRTAQPRRAGGAFGALLPAFDLATERAHRVDRLMYVGELVADPETQRELSVEVGLRRGRARVLTDLERGFVPLAADLEPNAILPGCADRSGEGRLGRFPGRIVLDAGGVGMPHVPGETVEAGFLGDPRLARLLDLLGALLLRRERLLVLLVLRLGRGALELADLLPLRVEERERDVALGLLAKPVRDEYAVGRVLTSVDVDLRLLAGRLLDLPVGDDGRAGHAVVLADLRGLREPEIRAEAHGRPRGEELRLAPWLDVGGELPDGRKIVEDPEAAAVRGQNEVRVLHDHVVDRHDRQAAAEPTPLRAVVKRDVHAGLRARVEKTLARGVLADHAGEVVSRDPVRDLRPSAAEVLGFEEVRTEVIVLVTSGGDVRGPCVVRRGLDDRDERERPDGRGGHVLPGFPVVARHVKQSVVTPRPQHAALDGRFREREDRAVILGSGVVLGDGTAGRSELRAIVPRQVGADLLPRRPLVVRPEDVVARVIKDVRVMRRVHGRRGPLHPVLHRTRAFARTRLGPHHDVPRLSGPAVVAREDSLVVAREDHVGIVRANRDVPGLATADREAVGRGDPGDRGAARDGHRGVVLLGTLAALRHLAIRQHPTQPGRRLVVERAPPLTSAARDD